jgi:hypothetical protein
MSGYGAAIGELIDAELIKNISDINGLIKKMNWPKEELDQFLGQVIQTLDSIKISASKIGTEQRSFFKYLFKSLFLELDDTGKFSKLIVEKAYKRYKAF